jgi:3-(3-hydroxy-phenyl)propionate hydroxylase
MMPPFAGQGLNSGLKDATNLSWKLAAVLGGRLTDSALGSYELERRPNAEATVRYSQMRGRLMMTTSPLRAALRDRIVRAARPLGFLRHRLDHLPAKPHARYRSGMVISEGRDRGIAGEILPQPDVLRGDGAIVPLDDVLGQGFSLIGVDLEDSVLHGFRSPVWRWLDVRRVALILEERFPTGGAFSVADGRLTSFLARVRGQCVVVRPDRFVLGTFKPDAEDLFVARWQALGLRLPERGDRQIANEREKAMRIQQ